MAWGYTEVIKRIRRKIYEETLSETLVTEDGGIAFVPSSRAAGVTAHVQKPSLDLLNVSGSGGCVLDKLLSGKFDYYRQ